MYTLKFWLLGHIFECSGLIPESVGWNLGLAQSFVTSDISMRSQLKLNMTFKMALSHSNPWFISHRYWMWVNVQYISLLNMNGYYITTTYGWMPTQVCCPLCEKYFEDLCECEDFSVMRNCECVIDILHAVRLICLTFEDGIPAEYHTQQPSRPTGNTTSFWFIF